MLVGSRLGIQAHWGETLSKPTPFRGRWSRRSRIQRRHGNLERGAADIPRGTADSQPGGKTRIEKLREGSAPNTGIGATGASGANIGIGATAAPGAITGIWHRGSDAICTVTRETLGVNTAYVPILDSTRSPRIATTSRRRRPRSPNNARPPASSRQTKRARTSCTPFVTLTFWRDPRERHRSRDAA